MSISPHLQPTYFFVIPSLSRNPLSIVRLGDPSQAQDDRKNELKRRENENQFVLSQTTPLFCSESGHLTACFLFDGRVKYLSREGGGYSPTTFLIAVSRVPPLKPRFFC